MQEASSNSPDVKKPIIFQEPPRAGEPDRDVVGRWVDETPWTFGPSVSPN